MLLTALVLAAEPTLSPEQQREDFDQLWAALDAMHPSLYLYTPKEELDAIREEVRSRLDEPRSAGAFWAVLMDAVSPIGCGHTTVFPSEDSLQALIDGQMFPLDLVVHDDQLWVDPRTHAEGGRVVSVQGVPGDELLARLRKLTDSDGLSTPFQDYILDGLAPYLLPMALGRPSSYQVVLDQGGEVTAQTLPATGLFDIAEGSDPGPRFDDDRYEAYAIDAATGAREAPTRKNLAGRVLLIVLDGFEASPVRRRVVRPLRRAVRSGATGLIFDLRRNGGGSPWPAFRVFGHLIESPELVYDQRLYRWPYVAERDQRGNDEERHAMLTSPEILADRGVVDGLIDVTYGDVGTVHPRRPHFGGPVAVLTSGNTFSTGADFAALFKRSGRGTVVGIPTGGSATLQTSGATEAFELTYSRIRVGIPLNRSRLVDPEGRLAGSIGVQPDRPVRPSLDDLKNGRDPALDVALGLF